MNVEGFLARRINLPDINRIVGLCADDTAFRDKLLEIALERQDLEGSNALWCLTHLRKPERAWLQEKQDIIIDHLLTESEVARKRMLLQLLRDQNYSANELRTDLLDFCLSKINAEAEPYAVRCFAIYIACKMCRFYPELIRELNERLELLSLQSLPPGLRTARRKAQQQIDKVIQKHR